MAIDRFTASFKHRTNVLDNITPNYFHNSNHLVNPALDLKPAAWLPVQWTTNVDQDAFVISSGKVVALDAEGRMVPAGIGTKMIASGIAYTATDVTHLVTDITTGEKVAGAVSYTAAQVAFAILSRGLVDEEEAGAQTAAAVIPLFIKGPIGVAAYDIYVWAGDDAAHLTHHNYQKQHAVQFFTQAELIAPVLSPTADTTAFDVSVLTGTAFNATTNPFPVDGEIWEAAEISQVIRYAGSLTSASPVIALGLDGGLVAANTSRTPLTCDVATVLLRQVASADRVRKAGDYFLDADVAVLFLHSSTYAALVTANTDPTMSYYTYAVAAGAASGEKFLHILASATYGTIRPGDYLTVDADSNLEVFTPTTAAHILATCGRVLQIIDEPRNLMDAVKTAWSDSNSVAADQMPGTATAGYSDMITLTGERVANKLAVVWFHPVTV